MDISYSQKSPTYERMVIKPMLAKSSQPFDSEKHIFELKWDGARCISFVNKKKCKTAE